MEKFNVGVIGYGLSGRYFFSPFIAMHPGFNLAAVVTSQNEQVKSDYPGVDVCKNVAELLQLNGLDVVVAASPNNTHYEYAKQSLLSGRHVIVEKPFTVTSEEAEELIRISEEKQKLLVPFQNRRWDGDFLTVKKIISEGLIGEVVEYESHFDRYRPQRERVEWKNTPGNGTGTLYDLGPHLIDQALVLFGKPAYIYADIRRVRKPENIDDSFEVQLLYPERKIVLKAGIMCREPGPRFVVHGRKGSFIKHGLDPQEENLKQGMKPGDEQLGADLKANYGLLHTEINGKVERKQVKTLPGNYAGYFENVYQAFTGNGQLAVKPEEALQTIRVIEKAYQSSREKRVVPM
jgi:scyllo-inositol 2-dehydrogenase (NADP+)